MIVENLIRSALKKGQTALSEYESKMLLKFRGVPVVEESLAQSADEAVAIADRIGYPVVLKACGWELMHKSERGLVALSLQDEKAIRAACGRISGAAGTKMEGVLVQEMVPGVRELAVGLIRDSVFGPCVMLGLGGVLTEVFQDTVFRMAPIETTEALDMAEELRSRSILGEFRGQAPADMQSLCRTLASVGDIGLSYESVAEIDINPLIITPAGRLKAVDALIVLKRNGNAPID